MTSVSVAMATYNGAPYIREQLDSLAAQTVLPAELVVTDDGSTDATLDVVADFARTAPFPVHVHRNRPGLGFRGNFVKCAGLCGSDVIAFCDQDDVWLPQKLETQLADFEDPTVFLSCHNARLIDAKGRDLGRELNQFHQSAMLSCRTTSPFVFSRGFTQIIRKELLAFGSYLPNSLDIGDPKEPMSHDQWFFFLAFMFGSIKYHETSLSLYRQHDRNWSGAVETPRSKFVRRLSDRRAEYQRLLMVWKNRADLLATMLADERNASLFDAGARARMREMQAMYLDLRAATARRRDLYEARTPASKLAFLITSVMHGDYRPNSPWHFKLSGAARDIWALTRSPPPLSDHSSQQ